MRQIIQNQRDLNNISEMGLSALYPKHLKILVGSASCGIAMGAQQVEAAAIQAVRELGIDATVSKVGCIGFCSQEPLLDMVLPNGPRVSYGQMTPEKTWELLKAFTQGDIKPDMALGRFDKEEHLLSGKDHRYPSTSQDLNTIPIWSSLDFFKHQKKVILRNCGSIDPFSIEQSIARGTYRGALRAITLQSPEQVLETIIRSGLRGRGGAAFPTGQKWKFARQADGDTKYIVCNADEGEPAAYMDRSVLEGDPHAILEGMLIGSYAIGAREGFIYIRSEYPLAIAILEHAIAEAREYGLLGDNIFGKNWSFNVEVRKGAGAYVCGEETALIESIEGHAGEPRPRPPFPANYGIWGKPTVVNNVKTWASIAPIVVYGASWYKRMGTKQTPGTTVFSLEGIVKNAGLVEVPFGITLRTLIDQIGGGTVEDRPLKALQAGGAANGCLPLSILNLKIDAEDRPGETVRMGTGGIIAMDDSACMVDMARFLVDFFLEESCGKCVSCREGASQLLNILVKICNGRGTSNDLVLLERLAKTLKSVSNCGLGDMIPDPVLAALKNFPDEFKAHVHDNKCPAGVCQTEVEARS